MVEIQVCIGSACHLKGSYNVINAFQQEVEYRGLGDKVEVKAVFCLGKCTQAVSVKFGNQDEIHSLSASDVASFFDQHVLYMIEDESINNN